MGIQFTRGLSIEPADGVERFSQVNEDIVEWPVLLSALFLQLFHGQNHVHFVWPCLMPHCASGRFCSATATSLLRMTRAKILPGMERGETPL